MSVSHSQEKNAAGTRNFSRYCVENPHISWVLLLGTVVWGIYGYTHMPQRKDPDIPVKQAMVITPWPGASAEKVEDLVTRTVERTIASNSNVASIESTSRGNVSVIILGLSDNLKQTGQVLDDIGGRLAAIHDLPEGAGPVEYVRDFGDTATLMLTVASPKADAAEIAVRSQAIRKAIEDVRKEPARGRTTPTTQAASQGSHASAGQSLSDHQASLVFCFSPKTDLRLMRLGAMEFIDYLRCREVTRALSLLEGPGFIGVDGETPLSDEQLIAVLRQFLAERYREGEIQADLWGPFVVRDPANTQTKLALVAADKYSYRELEDFTDTMEKALLATGRKGEGPPLVAKVNRSGILPERIYLVYSQERAAAHGVRREALLNLFRARNLTVAGGEIDAGGKRLFINPSGEFRSDEEIGGVTIGTTPYGTPLYLRDVADAVRDYESPPSYLNFYSWRDKQGLWQRTRAITLSVQMGAGQQVQQFATAIDATLADLQNRLPRDLVIARTSDQPKQVEENVELFMTSLYEAIVLVVLVSLVGL